MSNFCGFIVHNYQLESRKKYLELNLKDSRKFQFIEIEKIDPGFASKYLGLNQSSWSKKAKNLWNPPPPPRELSSGELACTASHFLIYEKFLNESSEDWLVVIEDDAIFDCDLSLEIQKIIFDVPEIVNAVFIGGGYPHDAVSLTLGGYKNYLIKHHPATNTTVGYMLRRSLVQAITEDFFSFDMPIDYELAYLLMINNALVLHAHPYLISEGSKFAYQSSLGR